MALRIRPIMHTLAVLAVSIAERGVVIDSSSPCSAAGKSSMASAQGFVFTGPLLFRRRI